MLKLSVLVPDATVNYAKNPALRYDTTDWTAQGATISRVLTRARFGIASLQVVTNGSALYEGAFTRVSSLTGISEAVTVSAYVRGTGKVRIRLDNNVIGGTEFSSQAVQLTDDRWQRIFVTGFSTGGNDLRLFVETAEGTAKVRTFYVDGAQVERKAYPTTYCDGEQEGCRWDGVYHASSSRRDANTRAGGKWFQLAGEKREEEDLYMTVAGGLGMAPLTNNTQAFALAPGGYFSNKKVNMRVITLTFFAKHHINDSEEPVSLSHLHTLRQTLIDVVKPDLTGGDEPMRFEYDDGNKPLYFQARYEGGLEGEWDIRNQFVNSFPLRLLAENPVMEEDSQEAAVLDFQESIKSTYLCAMRKDGVWTHMNYGISGGGTPSVWQGAIGKRGEVVVVGTFTVVNNDANAIDPLRPASYVAYWDGEKWIPLATFGTFTNLRSVAIAANGDIYVGGSFSSINGVAANNIARWDGSAWNALGSGVNGEVSTICITPNGDVYVGGEVSLTSAGGKTVNCTARWNGVDWYRVGQYGGLNEAVYDIKSDADGSFLYYAGPFTDQNGNPGSGLNYVAKYNTVTGLFSAMGSGFDRQASAIAVTRGGYVYAGGLFDTSGSVSVPQIAVWNGSAWSSLGSGLTIPGAAGTPGTLYNGNVLAITILENDLVYVGGTFSRAGEVDVANLAIWNGANWLGMDFYANFGNLFTSGDRIRMIVGNEEGDIFVGWFPVGTPGRDGLCAGRTLIENMGTHEVFPKFYLRGQGFLRYIENYNTNKRLYFNLAVQPNEDIYIDTGNATIISTVRGSLSNTISPGSDFRSFTLLPGENWIACLMTNDVGAYMSIQFTPKHWSADATG